MCQISAVMLREGGEEPVMENVTELEWIPGGVRLSTMFDPPREMVGVKVKRIDFLGGRIYLEEN